MIKFTIIVTVLTISIIILTIKPNILDEYLERGTHNESEVDSSINFRVDTKGQDLIWIENSAIGYIKDGSVFKVDIQSRNKELLFQANDNYSGILFSENLSEVCTWTNTEKKSVDDFGTEVLISSLEGKEITNINLQPTLKIDSCSSKQMFLSQAFPFLEEKKYELNTITSYLTEITSESNQYEIKKEDKTAKLVKEGDIYTVIDSGGKTLGRFNSTTDIERFTVSKDEKYIGYIDLTGAIWVSSISK